MTTTTTPPHLTGALTIKELCDAYRLCREKAYGEIRARRLRAVKLGRKTLILRADAEAWAASLPELRTIGREQASAGAMPRINVVGTAPPPGQARERA
jgi:excisionase family DNA binding protein